MLFFLTGDIQIGKTRWLLRMLDELEQRGVQPYGVVAPGIWVPRDDGFEKLGIDNLLLPGKRKVPFARRRDLAQADGAYDEGSQAARADLKWAIDDAAIDIVNMHLDGFIEGEGVHSGLEERSCPAQSRFLVIDELGRLELLAGGGLTSALALLDRGATPMFPHALAVVRESLLDAAFERFAETLWNGMRAISPDARGEQLLLEAFECEP